MLEQKEEVGSWCIHADDRRTTLSSGRLFDRDDRGYLYYLVCVVYPEYKTLSDPQKVELKSWRQKQRNGKNNGKSKTSDEKDGPVTKRQLRSTVASVIQEQESKR